MYRKVLSLLLIGSQAVWAAPSLEFESKFKKFELEEKSIPKKPRTPAPVQQILPRSLPHCERVILFNEQKLEVDSNLGNDAEHLRRLVQTVPSAVSEIDQYQANRKNVRLAAYIGSAGLVAAGVGLLLGSQNPIIVPTRYLISGGVILAAGSFIFAIGHLQRNEKHLHTALENYNLAHPEQPIQIEFSTGMHF